MKDKLLRPDQVATMLNVSVRSIYRLLEEGYLRGLRIRGSIRILETSIYQYVDDQIDSFALETGNFVPRSPLSD